MASRSLAEEHRVGRSRDRLPPLTEETRPRIIVLLSSSLIGCIVIFLMPSIRFVNRLLSAAVVCLSASSCAISSGDRRPLLNYVDASLAPPTTAGRWLAAPVALPVALAAAATDAVILHPLSQIDDAWCDTRTAIWDFEGSSDFRKVLLMPLSAVATPAVFGVTWLFRASFDVEDCVVDTPSDEGVGLLLDEADSSEVGQ